MIKPSEPNGQTWDPIAGSTDPHSAGNGSIMRLAPVPMFIILIRQQPFAMPEKARGQLMALPSALTRAGCWLG